MAQPSYFNVLILTVTQRDGERDGVVQNSCLKQQCCICLRKLALFYTSNNFCSFAVGSGASETILFHIHIQLETQKLSRSLGQEFVRFVREDI